LEIHVRDKSGIVEVWLTRAEKENAAACEGLKPLYQEYTRKNYLVAVFLPGDQNLSDATCDLLRYNRRRVAQMEVERKKQSDMVMGMRMILT